MTNEMDTCYEYENILERMLDTIPDDIDKREGSVIYNAIAPAALELAQMYFIMKNNIDLCFADTAVDEYLDRLCEQIGVTRKKATKAIRRGQFFDTNSNTMDIEIGSRFSINDLIFVAIEKIETGNYKMECETAGTVGNECFGILLNIDYIENLGQTDLNQILIPGEDEEDDETLRNRYYEYVKETPFAGNVADYKQKIKEIDGVGLVHVITATDLNSNNGSVHIYILNSNTEIASEELIDTVQETIDPTQNGAGLGLAPIGHKVTIGTSTEYVINVKADITLQESITLDSIKNDILNAIEKYYENIINTEWENGSWTVRISRIENAILNVDGVLDISDTKLYNDILQDYTGNINEGSYKLPVIKEVNFNVIN